MAQKLNRKDEPKENCSLLEEHVCLGKGPLGCNNLSTYSEREKERKKYCLCGPM